MKDEHAKMKAIVKVPRLHFKEMDKINYDTLIE